MMINEPVQIVTNDFQAAWIKVVMMLKNSHWHLRNLVVQIKDPKAFNQTAHGKVEDFAKKHDLLGPKHVAYTIFPQRLYEIKDNADAVFTAYNKQGGFFERVQRKKPSWGTYFRRMSNYMGAKGTVNQLNNIISAIQNRQNLSKAAYTILIQNPGGETIRPLGGPCLNYIAIQAEPQQADQPMTIGLLAVYRNHDFLERAYGNYWGLCNLLMFLAKETCAAPGPLTCVSSHAYVSNKKTALRNLVESF